MWFKKRPRSPGPMFEIGHPPLERMRRWFKQEGISAVPATADQLTDLEGRCGVKVPEPFRAYLAAGAPTTEEMDSEFGTWWPIERMRTVPQEVETGDPAHARYLIFADYLIWSCAWAIACTDDKDRGRIIVIGGGDRFVADSFDAFIDKYLTDNSSIY